MSDFVNRMGWILAILGYFFGVAKPRMCFYIDCDGANARLYCYF